MLISGNREIYLTKAVELMAELFTRKEYLLPKLRVSCGWPHAGGTRAKKRVLGQAWPQGAAADGVVQIFISPYLSDPVSEYGVLATLLHELCHAAVGSEQKHNKVFGKCARAVGLTGKITSTVPSPEAVEIIQGWSEALGAYPHASLDLNKSPTKKQTARMVKCVCGACGYICRTTKTWLTDRGAPICPCNKESMTHESQTEGNDENDSPDSE